MSESFGNEVLYNMCKENPCHNDANVVEGKMWLIGRSYAASPERRQGEKAPADIDKVLGNNTDSDFFGAIAKKIAENERNGKSMLDKEIEQMKIPLKKYRHDTSEEDLIILSKTIELVKLLNEMVKTASNQYNEEKYNHIGYTLSEKERKAQNNISFASKYLHFHLPHIVFIMDSYSISNAKDSEQYPEIESQHRRLSKGFTEKLTEPYKGYAEHILRCYLIANKLKNEKKDFSPRAVDNVLMLRK